MFLKKKDHLNKSLLMLAFSFYAVQVYFLYHKFSCLYIICLFNIQNFFIFNLIQGFNRKK